MSYDRCDLLCLDAPRAESIRERLLDEKTAFGAAGRASALSDPTRLTLAAALFLVGLALSLAGASQVLTTGAYATAILVGGLPIFRAAVAGLRARQLDMNVLMGTATVGPAGIGEWADTPSATEKLRA